MRLVRTMTLAAGVSLSSMPPLAAVAQDGPPPGALAELRRGFTLGGAPVPPLVFRDLGDGDPTDLAPTLVAFDAWAAVHSERFALQVEARDGWRAQTARALDGGTGTETELYRYLGATPDGLMALVTENATSEGRYAPAMLRVVDAAVTSAFDVDGHRYDRITLTILAGYPLGDGWRGRATLGGDTVTVVTEAGAMRSTTEAGNTRVFRILRP